MNTKPIRDNLEKAFIDIIQSIVTYHIESHESHYCFYLRLHLMQFEEYIIQFMKEQIVLSSITQLVLVQVPALKTLCQ